MSMQAIEKQAKTLSEVRDALADTVGEMQASLETLKKQRLPGLRKLVRRVADAQAELAALVQQSPELFDKPKTRVMHGIKLGFQKEKGSIAFERPEAVCAAIRKKLPDLAETLIRVEEVPHKPALAQLTVSQLRSIGCEVVEAGDIVVVRAVDGEVDKIVNALMKGAEAEAQEH